MPVLPWSNLSISYYLCVYSMLYVLSMGLNHSVYICTNNNQPGCILWLLLFFCSFLVLLQFMINLIFPLCFVLKIVKGFIHIYSIDSRERSPSLGWLLQCALMLGARDSVDFPCVWQGPEYLNALLLPPRVWKGRKLCSEAEWGFEPRCSSI